MVQLIFLQKQINKRSSQKCITVTGFQSLSIRDFYIALDPRSFASWEVLWYAAHNQEVMPICLQLRSSLRTRCKLALLRILAWNCRIVSINKYTSNYYRQIYIKYECMNSKGHERTRPWPSLRYNPDICLQRLRNTRKNIRIVDLWAKILTWDRPNTKPQCWTLTATFGPVQYIFYPFVLNKTTHSWCLQCSRQLHLNLTHIWKSKRLYGTYGMFWNRFSETS